MVYPQQPPPGEYPPEYYNGGYAGGPRPWMPRVHTGFRYFLLLLIILLVVGYFTGSNPMQPVTNVVNPTQPAGVSTSNQPNQDGYDNNPANTTVTGHGNHAPMTITTTVSPNAQTSNAYTGVPVPAQNGVDPQTEMQIRQSQAAADANFDARAHRLKAIRASNTPTVPDGWYTWSVEKRARYVRALMDRIDAP